MSPTNPLDTYTVQAENNDLTPQEKITGLHTILKAAKTGMLTTQSPEGLHSRAMAPSSPFSATQISLVFLANNASKKFSEIQSDNHVNVSFYDASTTSWASYSGIARISQDKELIKKHWSSYVSAYFGDLKDGIHKGDENDPRVSVIEVIPDEVRYWVATKGAIGKAVDLAVNAATGKVSSPGELITITKAEIQLTENLLSK